jgi:hypothetical protein
MNDNSDLANVREELVAQSLSLRRPLYEPGDVHEFHDGRYDLLRGNELGNALQPTIGHADNSDVRFDRTERIVGGLRRRGGKCRKYGGLADVGKSDDPAIESHFISLDSISLKKRTDYREPNGGSRPDRLHAADLLIFAVPQSRIVL